MKKTLLILSLSVLCAGCTPTAPADDHMNHSEGMNMSSSASLDRLSKSPRHQEWVEVKNGNRTIYTWVVYPEVSTKVPAVILIHENKGLNDWARGMADQVAEQGYIAVAPDLLSGFSETRTRTSDFSSDDEATKAIGQLDPKQVMSDLSAVADWAKKLPSSNGKLVSAGFCWGGARSFEFATNRSDLGATLVFYGTGPTEESAYAKISSPVFGFYGGADERVNATIEGSKEAMEKAGKTYDTKIYTGAGHAFMRLGEDPSGTPENVAARNAAWERMKAILAEI